MKLAALAILSAGAMFAVDGTVHNATKDKAQGNATVSLFNITQSGPQMVASVKSAGDGSFNITPPAGSDSPGPKLLQAVYEGVTYNRMIPPGTPAQNLQVDVYESSNQPGASKVTTHMMLLEPVNGQLTVSESFVYVNSGKVTYNDPDHGTLRFYLPPGTGGKVEVNVTAPNSVAVRRAPDPTNVPNVYKLDVPVKPGESRIDLAYQEPFTTPGHFETHVLYKNPNTKLLAPAGVTVEAVGLTPVGQEPQTKASIFNFDGADLKIDVQGTGALQRQGDAAGQSDDGSGDQGSAQVSELMPQLYDKTSVADGLLAAVGSVKWILLIVSGMLGLGFSYLYRRGAPRAEAPNSVHESKG